MSRLFKTYNAAL